MGDKRFNEIPYRQFIDYRTGDKYPYEDSMDTKYYWKPLSELLEEYIDHPESKSNGDIGLLQRKFIVVDMGSVHYIGKESNELDESTIVGVNEDSDTIYENSDALYQKILAMKEEDAAKVGISARTLYYWKAQTREGRKIVLNDKVKAKMT